MFLACIIAIVVLDQAVKFLVYSNMLPETSIPVFGNIFSITYIQNSGAAFGILENQRSFFIVVTLLILICGIYFYPALRHKSSDLNFGAALLFGGAVGNLIDRIRFGIVIDYFDIHFWPIFNIADMAIVAGVIIIIYHVCLKGISEK